MNGDLYIISTPIGNPNDITFRALRVLKESDVIICEEKRVGATLLAHYQIIKPLVELNEHATNDEKRALVERLKRGENLALISDHGTPLVQDPGAELVSEALRAGIRVMPVPGASAILAALVTSGLPAARFRFVGQLPPKKPERARALRELRNRRETLVLVEAPYRLLPLLSSLQDEFESTRQVVVACNLTESDENFVRGGIGQVFEYFKREPFKGEFVIIVEGLKVNKLVGSAGGTRA